MSRTNVCLTLVLLAAAAVPARAHFLFVRICPAAEGGRFAEVYFSELAAAGDPRYIDKVATGTYWLQTAPGKFQPLAMHKLADRLRAHVPTSGTLMVVGQLDYGVLARPAQKPFLLRHYSKAVAGTAAEINALKPKGARLEIVPRLIADGVELTALLDGKPMPETTFTTVDQDLSGDELKADAQGRATFAPPAAGVYSIYIRHVDPTSGEHGGQKYDEVREFATLAFAWPLAPAGADREAVAMFEEALAARAAWHDFPGFTAKIDGAVDDRPFEGSVAVAADGSVKLALEEDVVSDWVDEQLASITMHRAAPPSGGSRSQPVLRFADAELDHPLGRLLVFDGGSFASSYRVKDRQITVVNRLIDGQNMTIRVLENGQNAEGQFLPHLYTVQYWDEKTGRLDRCETVEDSWTRVGKWDLPTGHTVSTSSSDGLTLRSFRLSDHQLASPKAE